MIWKLDRLGRSLRHLVDLVSTLMEKGVDLKSLQDPIDTTHSQGRFVFNLFATLAEFERDLIRRAHPSGTERRPSARPPGRKAEGIEQHGQEEGRRRGSPVRKG